MLNYEYLLNNFQYIEKKIRTRIIKYNLKLLLKLLQVKKHLTSDIQIYQKEKNKKNKLYFQKKIDMNYMQKIRLNIKKKTIQLKDLNFIINKISLNVPNIPMVDVPIGKNDIENIEIKKIGFIKEKSLLKNHAEIGILTNTIDILRAVKISGRKFTFLKGYGSLLNRALTQYMMDFHVNMGDCELNTPYLVNENSLVNTGQFPKFKNDIFTVQGCEKKLFLIPTSEVTLTNYFSQEIINEDRLPIRLCSATPCFRLEAGAAGKNIYGITRMHQFEKVEMVRITTPEQALMELSEMVNRVSKILENLELPHRIIKLCTGDLGFSAKKTYDIEVWLPGVQKYCEISSCSIFGSFQARRANIRYREKKISNKIVFATTLNGSGLPLGRTLAAIYENYQKEDGSIIIPNVLWKYTNGIRKIPILFK